MGEQVFAIFILPRRTLVRPVSEAKCVGNKVCRKRRLTGNTEKTVTETATNSQRITKKKRRTFHGTYKETTADSRRNPVPDP